MSKHSLILESKAAWDEYFLSMLPVIAKKSKDKHTQVGCVIVGPDHEIRSTGYNSLVRGLKDNVPTRLERPEKYKWIEHADRNAIYNAARMGTSVNNCTMYLPWYPCIDCARAIISAGITDLVIGRATFEERLKADTYIGDREVAITMFNECGVKVRFV